MFNYKCLMFVLIIGFAVTVGANAAMIDPATLTATSSTSHATYPDPMEVVNASGMSGDTHASSWGSWFTDTVDPDRWIVVDLAGSYSIGQVKVYNANEAWGWSIIGFDETAFYVANMDDPGNPVDNADNWTLVTTQKLTQAPGTADYNTPDIVNLLGATGTHIALQSLTVTGAYSDDRAGLSEIQIYEIPEPATLSLLVLGIVGLARRKRS